MTKISALHAREILDSRGNPTLDVCISAARVEGQASVPSGASVGSHEALELRDGDKGRYGGKGVLKAVRNINEEVTAALVGKDFDQRSLDEFLITLDGTPNKSRLGGNTLIGISMAFARAAAAEQGVALYRYLGDLMDKKTFSIPMPTFNVLNGGKHANNGLSVQECMLIPVGFSHIAERLEAVAAVIDVLKKELRSAGYDTGLGDEGGFAPRLHSSEEALDLLVAAITEAGHTTEQIKLGIDVAASGLLKDGSYLMDPEASPRTFSAVDMLAWYVSLADRYPLVSIEDGFAEDDWEDFAALKSKLEGRARIVGDDLLVTNAARIETAAKRKAVDTVIIKPNQAGTITETAAALRAARGAGMSTCASHRSGETNDTFIADLAVGFGCEYIKAGSLAREERVAKYNRLSEIEEELGH